MTYPERGRLVDVVEGGTLFVPVRGGFKLVSIQQGGARYALKTEPEWEAPERSERPGVWVNLHPGSGPMGILSPSSWWPIEGPALPEVLP